MKKVINYVRGVSLHVALDQFDNNFYSNSTLSLKSAERDAIDIAVIARLSGFTPTQLIGKDATREKAKSAISQAGRSLKAGDFFLLTFSGFGGHFPVFEKSRHYSRNDTWCLFNGQLLVKEVLGMLQQFAEGVKILVIADCSNTWFSCWQQAPLGIYTKEKLSPKSLPTDLCFSLYLQEKDLFDGASLKDFGQSANSNAILWVSACQANQTAFENDHNGLLTAAIKRMWAKKNLFDDYFGFFDAISIEMPVFQSPKTVSLGTQAQECFKGVPFSI